MKKLVFLLVCLFTLQTVARADDDKPIQVTQMPQLAQQFIKQHFSDSKVALAKMESDFLYKSYEVIFTNGNKVEFDKKGNWEEVDFPKREVCNIHESLNLPPMDFSADLPQLPFMRAPLSLMYPNSPAEYLFARIKLNEGEVATFRFIPPTAPKSVSEYATADVRYWSICLGSAETYSYASIYDKEMPRSNPPVSCNNPFR